MTRPRIAYTAASGDTFIRPIMGHLAREYDTQGPIRGWPVECDLLWLEWADQAAVDITRNGPKTCPIICRFHSFELFTDLPRQIAWEWVDAVVFVAEHVKRRALERFPDIAKAGEILVIPNGVDLEKFTPGPERERGKVIGWVGGISHKKGPDLFAQVVRTVCDNDAEASFRVAGEFQDPRYEAYFDKALTGFRGQVEFCGKVPPHEMPDFYRSCDFILSTSPWESFQYAIAEGVLCGCDPIVYDWEGADEVYRTSWIWWAPEQVLWRVRDGAKPNPEYIAEHYSRDVQMTAIRDLLDRTLHTGIYRPSIAACMIVKGDEPRLKGALQSLNGSCEEVCVMVDIRHGKHAVKVAEAHGARVFPRHPKEYHGCIDFAFERNWIARQAKADWVFVLDADELLTDADAIPRAVADAEVRGCDGVALDIACYTDQGLAEEAKDVRIYRNNGDIGYVYPVHNQLRGHRNILPADITIRSTYVGGLKGKGSRGDRSIPPLTALWNEACAELADPSPRTPAQANATVEKQKHAAFFLCRMAAAGADNRSVLYWADVLEGLAPGDEFAAPFWRWYALSAAMIHGADKGLEIMRRGLGYHPGHPDLLHLGMGFFADKWSRACGNGFLGTPMNSRQFLPNLSQAASALGLPIKTK